MATRAKVLARSARSVSAFDAGQRAVEAGHHRLQRVLRRVEQEVRLPDVVRRLAVGVDELQEVGSEGEGRDVGRGREQLLEARGVVAFERCAGVLGLQAFEFAGAGKDIGDRERDGDAAPRAVEQRVLRDRQKLVVGADRGDGLRKLDLARLAHRAGGDRRDEAPAGAGDLRRGLAGRILQHDDAGDHRLRGGAMLFDVGFGDGGQAGVHTFSKAERSGLEFPAPRLAAMLASPLPAFHGERVRVRGNVATTIPHTSEITCPFDRMWTL